MALELSCFFPLTVLHTMLFPPRHCPVLVGLLPHMPATSELHTFR